MLKKLFLALSLCLTLAGCQAALAETVYPVPADRIELAPKIGVVMSLQKRDGYAHVVVDTENSDFEKTLSYGGFGDENFLDVRVAAPVGAAWLVQASGSFRNDAEAISAIEESLSWGEDAYMPVTADYAPTVSRGWRNYFPEEELLTFWTDDSSTDLALRWYAADKTTVVRTEVLRFTHGFTSMQSRSVKLRSVPATDIYPNANGLTGVTYKWDDGELIYILSPEAVGNSDSSILTRVSVPSGAKWVQVVNYWGDEKERIDVSGSNFFTASLPYKKSADALKDGSDSDYASYVFWDADGNLLPGGGKCTISFVNQSDNRLALNYLEDENWSPVPASRLRCFIEPGADLVQLSYSESDGLLHIGANPQKTAPNELDARNLPNAARHYQVTPPQGATAYRSMSYILGGPRAFGSADAETWQMDVEYFLESSGAPRPIPASGTIDLIQEGNEKLFGQCASSQHGVDLFKVAAETELGRASFFAVEWTFADGSAKVEWLGENADAIVLKSKTYACEAADELPSSLNGPAYIWKDGRRYTLYAEFRAQEGKNAYVIDMKLLDENGDLVTDFDGPLEFYLPYPQGHGSGEGHTYKVTHYFAPNMLEHEAVLEMSCEPQGVRFRTASLSPIELSWDASSSSSAPPQTGDASHAPLWFALCLLSLTGAVLLVWKKKKA